ncbi:unnamed protein product [Xylocopa violacea]|uniref:Uncharacterized protein n=1 Tax=Xylocopa violacea TaxID=135666 RepID=A0ABP1P4A9_XYLVO
MEDDIDIYEDLPSFGTEHSGNFVSNNQENVVEEELKLKKQIADLTVKLENFQKINKSLEINLHSLLKTAKAEIARKDKMIDELRKDLDDIAFKRSKTNDSVVHKSTNREAILNKNHKLPNICFTPDVNDAETSVIDPLCNRSKNQPNKSTLMPITVFGERLVKRIAEDQNFEKGEKQSSKFGSGNDNSETNDGYIVESDKENGSLNSTINICNTKEIKSPVSLEQKSGEHTKCPLVVSTITTKDIRFNGKNETGSKLQRKSVLTISYTGKRANEETGGHIPTKQLKSSNEKYISQSLEKDTNCNITFESEEKSLLPVYANMESAPCVNEGHSLRNSDTVCTRNSGTELKKQEHHLNDTNKKEDTKNLKNKNNVSHDKEDANKRSSKRCKNSVQNLLKFTLDERYIDYRCSDVFKKGDYQSNHSEYYRSRRREHHRTDDHRSSRVKPISHAKSSREERYSRNQYNKHSNYEKKFEKRYNFRNNSKDKSKHFKKDSYNVRSVIKHSTTDRISTSETVANVKKNNSHNEYESRKIGLKSSDKPTGKWENKQNECYEYSHCKSRTENFSEHQKYSEFSKHIDEIDDQVVGQIDRIAQTEKAGIGVHDELRKYVKEELENTSIDLEDGEISTTPNGSLLGNVHDQREESHDHQVTVHRELNSSSTSDNLYSMTSSKYNIIKPDTVSVSSIATNVASVSADRKSSANTESIESIENVENIEKFIRDYGFNSDKTIEEVLVTSDTICVSNNSLPNASSVGKEDEGDVRNREINSSDCRVSSRNANDTVSSISGEKSENISKDDPLEHVKRNDKRIGLNSIKLTKHDHSSNDLKTENDRNNVKINLSNCVEKSRKMKVEQKCASTTINAMREKQRGQHIGKQMEVEDFKKPLENRCDKNTKVTSTNIHGKIVVFARRKKPVCLTNSNANMIVVVNNGTDISCNSSNISGATECDSVSKFVKTCGYDTTNTS